MGLNGLNPSSREESSVASDDTINNCDDICDTNDDEIETDEKENDRVTVAKQGILMQGISECGDQEDGSVDGEKKMVSSLGVECDDHWEKDDENNNLVLRDISNAPGRSRYICVFLNFISKYFLTERRARPLPRPLCLSQISDGGGEGLETIPTVVLTPDSPPQQHSPASRKVKTLYTPDQTKVETTVIERDHVFFPPESLEEDIQQSLTDLSEDVIICGRQNTLSHSYIDLVPGLGPTSLPARSVQSISDQSTPEEGGLSVTRSTTSLTQGKLHVVKDCGDGNISIATTTFCGVRHSVLSTTSNTESKPNAR